MAQHWSTPIVKQLLRQIYGDISNPGSDKNIALQESIVGVNWLILQFQSYVSHNSTEPDEIIIRMLYSLYRIASAHNKQTLSYLPPPRNLLVLVALHSFKLQYPQFRKAPIKKVALEQFDIENYVSPGDEHNVAVLIRTEINVPSQARQLNKLPVMKELIEENKKLAELNQLAESLYVHLKRVIESSDKLIPLLHYRRVVSFLEKKTDKDSLEEGFIDVFRLFKITVSMHSIKLPESLLLSRVLKSLEQKLERTIFLLESLASRKSELLYPDALQAMRNLEQLNQVFKPLLLREQTTYVDVHATLETTELEVQVSSEEELQEDDWQFVERPTAESVLMVSAVLNSYGSKKASEPPAIKNEPLNSSCRSVEGFAVIDKRSKIGVTQ